MEDMICKLCVFSAECRARERHCHCSQLNHYPGPVAGGVAISTKWRHKRIQGTAVQLATYLSNSKLLLLFVIYDLFVRNLQELRPSDTLALLALWLTFLAVTHHAPPTNGKAPCELLVSARWPAAGLSRVV